MILVNFHLLCSCSCHLPKVFSSKFTIVFLLKAVHNKIVGGLSPLAFCTAGLKPHYNLFCELLLPRIQNANLAKDFTFSLIFLSSGPPENRWANMMCRSNLALANTWKKRENSLLVALKLFNPRTKSGKKNHRKSKVKTFSTHHINCELSSRG